MTIGCSTFAVMAFLLVAVSSAARAQESNAELPAKIAHEYVQAWLGATDADEAWTIEEPTTNSDLPGDYSTLPLLGGVGQRMWGNRAQFGFEGGGLVSWKSDKIAFAASNGQIAVRVDTELFLMDVFLGGVLSVRPARWLRIYAAAGPSIAWGYLPSEDDDEVEVGPVGTGSGIFIDLSSSERDFSFALYGRVGLDIELKNGFTFGVSARYAEHEFDFSQRGELKLDEMQYFLTLGSKL